MSPPQAVRLSLTLDPPGSVTNPTQHERITIDAPGLSMDEALMVLQRGVNYVFFSLVRNTVMRDLKREAQGGESGRVVIVGGVEIPKAGL